MDPLKLISVLPLQQNWTPPTLPERNCEFNEIIRYATMPIPRNIFVSGPRGIGKTVTAKRVCEEYKARFPSRSVFYIQMYRGLSETWDKFYMEKPKCKRNASTFKQGIGDHVLIVLDDVDCLYRKNDLNYLLHDLFNLDRQLCVILISTQSLYTYERTVFTDAVKSRCQFMPFAFRPYNVNEIASILQMRLNLAVEGSVSQDALKFISEKVYRHGSDMRLGLRILANAVNLAVQSSQPLTLTIAEQAWRQEKQSYWRQEYMELPPHMALLLFSVCVLLQKGEKVTSGAAYKMYNELCRYHTVKPLSTRQLSAYLSILEQKGFLSTSQSMSNLGKTTTITSDLPLEILVEAGRTLDWQTILK
ncbi:MAG: DnaA/Hda family protein [Candidatus Bathyarchaeota archaeon]|nr:DnaA/Hda family protein [Candidatus Bathyarchaeota archaeon]